MRTVWLVAAAVIGVSALTACGGRTGSAASGSGSPAPATGPPAAAACGTATPTASPGRTLTLSATDSGGSFCIKRGTGVLIYLKGTQTAKWGALKSSSPAMAPRANGHLALQVGVTGGYFVAVQPGTAAITSSRSPCTPQAPTTASTGPTTSNQDKGCGVSQTFRVTVRVVG
jgi:hypothetical protein